MADSSKNIQEFTAEIAVLKERIRELEAADTERKRAEEALRGSENKFRFLVNHSYDLIWILRSDGVFSYVSPSWKTILGYEPSNMAEKAFQPFVHPGDVAECEQYMIRVLDAKEALPSSQYRVKHADGSWQWHEGVITPVFADDGSFMYFVGVSRDITERKRAEDALRASEEKYRTVFETTGTASVVLEKDGTISLANAEYVRLSGYSRDEIENRKTWMEFVVKEDLDHMAAQHALRRKDQDAALRHYEFRFVRRSGEIRNIYLTINMVPGTTKSIASLLDITERKRAEEAVRESQRRMTDIIEFLPDATLVIDKDGRVIAWNRAMESMTGVKAEAMLGKGDYEYALPFYGERRPILIDIALRTDLEKETAYTTIHRTGDIVFGESYTPALPTGNVHLSATASVLRNSSGEIIGAIECIRNSTERKVMEDRLRRAEKMESLGVLAGGVAHDMNNVLGVLVGYSELLLREVPAGSRAGKYAKSILQGGERAAAIIQDLLTMARRGVSVSEAVNLNLIVADSFKTPEFELMKSRYPEILFRPQVEKDLLNVKGSPVHISKTIMNLLSNAAESISGAGEVTITTENRYVDLPIPGYEDTQEGEYVVLTVSDTGSGIPPADLGRIFEPFYTKKAMGRSGTGLGLAVVWGTMKDHGGYIDVRSEESKGSTFTLYFPATREYLPKGGQYLSPDIYSGQGESILVVDDIEEQRLLAATILEELNYRVATAASGEDAVEYLRANKADLIVLDMIMEPGIDGLETYRRILKTQSKQKAIIVSGFAKTDRVRAAQELGAGEYVKKPYVIEKLGIAVRKELDRK